MLLRAVAILLFVLTAAESFECNSSSLTNPAYPLFIRQLNDVTCPAVFDCFLDFCDCVDGPLSTTCAPFNVSAAALQQCSANRVACLLNASLSRQNVTNATCNTWLREMDDAYYAYFNANASTRQQSPFHRACVNDACAVVQLGAPASAGVINFTAVCAFSHLPLPFNMTPTPTPTATPPTPTTLPPATPAPATVAPAVSARISGSAWAVVLSNNRSAVEAAVVHVIAQALNVSADRVTLVNVSVGSLVVVFRIRDKPADAAMASQLLENANVSALATVYAASGGSASEALFLSSSGVWYPPATSSPHQVEEDKCTEGCIGGAVAGAVALIFIVVVAVVLCRRSPSSTAADAEYELQSPDVLAANAEDSSDYKNPNFLFGGQQQDSDWWDPIVSTPPATSQRTSTRV